MSQLQEVKLKGSPWFLYYVILKNKYPLAFNSQGKALAIGIDKQIMAENPQVEPALISRFFKTWTRTEAYLTSLNRDDVRINLDGTPAGAIDEDHRLYAGIMLARLNAKTRRKAKRRSCKVSKKVNRRNLGWEFREQVLRVNHPKLFCKTRVPLAPDICNQIIARYSEASPQIIVAFMNSWQRTLTYRASFCGNEFRYNLDETVHSEVSEDCIEIGKRAEKKLLNYRVNDLKTATAN